MKKKVIKYLQSIGVTSYGYSGKTKTLHVAEEHHAYIQAVFEYKLPFKLAVQE